MKIIISPSKTMIKSNNNLFDKTIPIFNNQSIELSNTFKDLSIDEISKRYSISLNISKEVLNYINKYDINGYTQCILSYTGLMYKNIDINNINNQEYLLNNIYIISALYGLLKPSDMISLYRFDFDNNTYNGNLYDYWSDIIYQEIFKNNDIVINLCSKEYSKVFDKYVTNKDKMYNICFKYQDKKENIKVARGKFIKYLINNNITTIDELIKYHDNGYRFDNIIDNNIIFIK